MQATFLPFVKAGAPSVNNRKPAGKTGFCCGRAAAPVKTKADYKPEAERFADNLRAAAKNTHSQGCKGLSGEEQQKSVNPEAQGKKAGAAAGSAAESSRIAAWVKGQTSRGDDCNAAVETQLVEMLAEFLQRLGFASNNESVELTGEAAAEPGPVIGAAVGQLPFGHLSGMPVSEIRQLLLKLFQQANQDGESVPELGGLKVLEDFIKGALGLPVEEFNEKLALALRGVTEKMAAEPDTVTAVNVENKAPLKAGEAGKAGVTSLDGSISGDKAAPAGKPGVQAAEGTEHEAGSALKPSEDAAGRQKLTDAGPRQQDAAKTALAEDFQGTGDEPPKEGFSHLTEITGQNPAGGKAAAEKGANTHESTWQDSIPADLLNRMAQNSVREPGSVSPVLSRFTQTVFGQIVQKAKLTVQPGMSEVQIQLKPDFLGRLDLNITSENGVVTAKFHAENYRVKEVIEANLNILKDALSEQGVKVDQLTVDVGTHRDHGGLREREAAARFKASNRGIGSISGTEEAQSLFEQAPVRSTAGEFYGSTVDFTA